MKIVSDFWKQEGKEHYIKFIEKMLNIMFITLGVNLISAAVRISIIEILINTAVMLIIIAIQISKISYNKEEQMKYLNKIKEMSKNGEENRREEK